MNVKHASSGYLCPILDIKNTSGVSIEILGVRNNYRNDSELFLGKPYKVQFIVTEWCTADILSLYNTMRLRPIKIGYIFTNQTACRLYCLGQDYRKKL